MACGLSLLSEQTSRGEKRRLRPSSGRCCTPSSALSAAQVNQWRKRTDKPRLLASLAPTAPLNRATFSWWGPDLQDYCRGNIYIPEILHDLPLLGSWFSSWIAALRRRAWPCLAWARGPPVPRAKCRNRNLIPYFACLFCQDFLDLGSFTVDELKIL